MDFIHSIKPFAALGALSLLAACGSDEPGDVEEPAAATETQAELQMETADQKISYAMGYQMADRFSNDPVLKLDQELLIQGIQDALAGEDMAISQTEAQAAGQELQQRAQEEQQAAGEKAKAAGEAFLAANKSEPGVTTTDSGLQYKVLEEGDSEESPEPTDTVTVHYHGTLPDGAVFDSSVDRGEPATFQLNQVIAGWTEGLQHMTVGDKYRFFVPSDLAYGARSPSPAIPPNSVLVFDVELLGINE